MSRQGVTLGSESLQRPQTTVLEVSASTCSQLSLFKEVMREYRKLDDSVTMRMNRNTALFRDRSRTGKLTDPSTAENEACAYFWRELVANWKSRTEIIDYCINVLNTQSEDKERAISEGNRSSAHFEDQVKKAQMQNEKTVERIVRSRSYNAFRSRCKFFVPPKSEAEARKWWDEVSDSENR